MNSISFEQLRAEMLDTPAAIQAYNDADRELAIVEMLYQMRERAGLSKSELAKKLGISPSAITRLEGNPLGASVKTLSRYASACGANFDIRMIF
ncbi:helix-turn-helix transcriptional regulator [Xenorhabdus nematophila]|uniref:helix-turn-helix domain-containing protein n=1 Tax=Xenorhabdus nematophila TaxID=628 RepID=UPI0003275275|nr:helix-turn-helix transcriptional regulator [Xenorhabdus nematophila]CEE94292.1 Gp48 [Xenorhabdus nematophila str. Anatoliense]CEF29869.1 Gp48 [Xenorhabdus nematophila str. Websteri]AYA41688.1 XRE family transcriptional regulator [Xenorhabdus nematophila]KHD29100.1 DNA-binding protein [Xenorhabdus nematophila]MBA0020424.1 helix-turn-helix transcriptional regulator [Xenorhabdus nematophila]